MVASITKEEIAGFDVEVFPWKICVINSEEEADKAVEQLRQYKTIGFDTETKPCFKKGQKNKIALIQLAVANCCYLFRLNKIGIPESLKNLLHDSSITKIGLSLKDDFAAMSGRTKSEMLSFIDLQHIVNNYGIDDKSLQKIYAILFRKRISKAQRLSNWETETLTEAQKAYAAIDAWACLRIYDQLTKSESISCR
jgi:ribonuclease D